MSYKILKSFWELLAPAPIRRSTPEPVTEEFKEYREIIATNKVGEKIVLHLPRNYSLSYN